MKMFLDCYSCFVRQALEAARLGGGDERKQHAVLLRVLKVLQKVDLSSTPPEIGRVVHRIVRDELGIEDPYQCVKRQSTERALRLYPRLKSLVREARDPLSCAVRVAAVGNVIDFGPPNSLFGLEGLWGLVEQLLAQPLAIDHIDDFRQAVARAEGILYLADNAGETVFDRVLMETLDRPARYVVKGTPVLNDATWEDATAAGIDETVEIVSNGTDAPGTILSDWPPALRHDFSRADLVIAKGQANYETLSESDGNVYFLLKVKCPIIARDLKVPVGSIVVKRGGDSYAKI